jgi:hypothetical protein
MVSIDWLHSAKSSVEEARTHRSNVFKLTGGNNYSGEDAELVALLRAHKSIAIERARGGKTGFEKQLELMLPTERAVDLELLHGPETDFMRSISEREREAIMSEVESRWHKIASAFPGSATKVIGAEMSLYAKKLEVVRKFEKALKTASDSLIFATRTAEVESLSSVVSAWQTELQEMNLALSEHAEEIALLSKVAAMPPVRSKN